MYKKIVLGLSLILLVSGSQIVKAEDIYSLYKKDPEEFYKKMMCIDEEAERNGYYSDARNKVNQQNNNMKDQSNYNNSGINKGYVFGDDELHVIGTPSNNKGYTAAGDYTNIPSKGKGWVYDADELHVVGLPTDPETGYTLPGYYGEIEK